MKIYFAFSTQNTKDHLKNYTDVYNYLVEKKYNVVKNYAYSILTNQNKRSKQVLVKSEKRAMLKSDLVIIDATVPSFGLGALFGLAAMHKKNILCIHNETHTAEISDAIKSYDSALAKSFEYNSSNLVSQLDTYFKAIKPSTLTKFNFIASQEVMNYIKSESTKSGKSQSEFLRDLISTHFLRKT